MLGSSQLARLEVGLFFFEAACRDLDTQKVYQRCVLSCTSAQSSQKPRLWLDQCQDALVSAGLIPVLLQVMQACDQYPMECKVELVLGEAHAGNPHVQALGLKCLGTQSRVESSFLRIPPLHTGLATLCGNSTSIQAQKTTFLNKQVTGETPFATRPKESLARQAGLFQAQGIPAILNAIRSAADTRHNRHNLSLKQLREPA